MKKFLVFVLTLTFVCASFSLYAGKKEVKGASEKAYEHASDEAVFNRVGDWFATIGKSDEEKEKVLIERKAKRAAKKAKKKAEKAAKESKKKAKKVKEALSVDK